MDHPVLGIDEENVTVRPPGSADSVPYDSTLSLGQVDVKVDGFHNGPPPKRNRS